VHQKTFQRVLAARHGQGSAMQPMTGPITRPELQPVPHPMPQATALRKLPLVTLYLTERCNSRCVSCDYWRHGRVGLTLERLQGWLPGLAELGTRVVVFSGGEPVLHPQWAAMAQLLRAQVCAHHRPV
jgi:MoaA/NifB/PqqE/SkfB family radical SAM enzyme